MPVARAVDLVEGSARAKAIDGRELRDIEERVGENTRNRRFKYRGKNPSLEFMLRLVGFDARGG